MIFSIAALALAGAVSFGAALCFCHMFQLEGYSPRGYIRYLTERGLKNYFLLLLAAVLFTAASIVGFALEGAAGIAGGVALLTLFAAAGALYISRIRIKDAKKPLVYTARVKRMLATYGVLLAALLFAMYFCPPASASLLLLLIPLHIIVPNAINAPMEKAVKKHYYNDAKRRLAARNDLIKIGITGSYGKTSTKFILGAILGEKYSVLVPPSSFNTPMGLTRVIREQLLPEHEVFLAEMGAKHVGDIKELTDLVHPRYGIVTSVGPQHLETFGNIENIAKTKYELIEALPQDGAAFFPEDGAITGEMYEKTVLKKYLFGLEAKDGRRLDVTAENITPTEQGSEFTVVYAGGRFAAKTRLLGRHNIANILGGVAVALELRLAPEEIARGIEKIEPVEHRLQLIPTNNGVSVIDDAFNANPAGTRVAMDVLRSFAGRKFVVTPGMIELGAAEAEENRAFGRDMATAADIVLLVGPRHTAPIREGLLEGGFSESCIFTCASLAEASTVMGGMLKSGDVVLFENDLPDNYNE